MRTASGRHVAIAAYVRKRLETECQARGAAMAISRKTGFAPAHISNVIRGTRGVGYEFAYAMATYWGMTYAKLERITTADAQRAPASAALSSRGKSGARIVRDRLLPNLQATVAWARGSYPDAFLDQFEKGAKSAREDKPKKVWYAEIEAAFRHFEADARPRPSRRRGPAYLSGVRPRVKRDLAITDERRKRSS